MLILEKPLLQVSSQQYTVSSPSWSCPPVRMASTNVDIGLPFHYPTSLAGKFRTGPNSVRPWGELCPPHLRYEQGKTVHLERQPKSQISTHPEEAGVKGSKELSYCSVAVMLRGCRDTHTYWNHHPALNLLITTHCNQNKIPNTCQGPQKSLICTSLTSPTSTLTYSSSSCPSSFSLFRKQPVAIPTSGRWHQPCPVPGLFPGFVL